MILQALYEYYQRKAACDEKIAPQGFDWVDIPYVLVISNEGKLVNIESTKEGVGKKKTVKKFLVPKPEKKASGIKSNLLWENAEYALGVEKDAKSKDRHKAFVERIEKDLEHVQNHDELIALKKFLSSNPASQFDAFENDDVKKEIKESYPNVVFRVAGSKYDSVCSAMKEYIKTSENNTSGEMCLICEEKEPIARLHSAIKGVKNAQSSGAALVSYNLDSFCSFGKKQNFNAPISEKAADAYTIALNMMLAKESSS
jgi:CRISPR-associated protein Csd1